MEFDDAVTAPMHGFEDAHDYYARSSSMQFLRSIRRPTLLLSARDDPFLPSKVLDDVVIVTQDSSYVVCEFHRRGGHVGFVSGTVPWRPHFYAEERVASYLQQQVTNWAFSSSASVR